MKLSSDKFNIPTNVYDQLLPTNIHDSMDPILSTAADKINSINANGLTLYVGIHNDNIVTSENYSTVVRDIIKHMCTDEGEWLFDDTMLDDYTTNVVDQNDEIEGDDDDWGSLAKGWLIANGCPTDLLYDAANILRDLE